MFPFRGFKETQYGFLWKVIEVFKKEWKYQYLKAVVSCADENELSLLPLSMLYVCPLPPSEKLLAQYRTAHQAWLNAK